MDLGYLTPALERLYIDEVLYLHSLWRRGSHRNPNPHPNPTLRPATSAAFKKETKKKKKSKSKGEKKWERKKQQQLTSAAVSDQPLAKAIEWPCNPTPEKNAAPATWADLTPPPATSRPPASAEEQARAAADLAQKSGLKACEDFFSRKDSSDDGEEDEDEDDSMDDGEEERRDGDFEFFSGLFKSDGELRDYYEKNWEKGDFSCLVCGAMGVKKWKRFGNCVGLIQHSNSISKTKRREAHRAFARAVCGVLGWDINRLGQSLAETVDTVEANPQQDMQREDADPQEDLSVEVEELSKEVAEDVETDRVDSMDCIKKEIEALPTENLQKEAEIDQKENDEDLMQENLQKEDLMQENLQKEVEIDEKENDEDLMD